MMLIQPVGRTIPEVSHHRVSVNGTQLHYVSAGTRGSPILLIHGFPESWWAFHKLIPLLAEYHRVIAVDLRGFGDSDHPDGSYDSKIAAEDLRALTQSLALGPVHLVAQDISGGSAFRFAAGHPDDILSFTAIEMGLAGFGLENLADVAKGGAWHIGVLAAPGIAELLLAGRERSFLEEFMFPALCATPGAISDADIAEFARTYARDKGWSGAAGLYASMLSEGGDIKALAEAKTFNPPVLAIGAGGGDFTAQTMARVVSSRNMRLVALKNVGHYAVMEAPGAVANALLEFTRDVDRGAALGGT